MWAVTLSQVYKIINHIGCSDLKNLLSEIGVDGSDDLIGLLVYSLRGK
jgi:hypothetical protein